MPIIDKEKFLKSSVIIDHDHPSILRLARELGNNTRDRTEIARCCFEFVRDEVRHSYDYRLNPVTCRASDVLEHRTGYCYAKSHLLAALLRSLGIPAGLCYQRLVLDEYGRPFCLHGLNAVFLESYGWYRMDARGNREDICAQFDPPRERLAYSALKPGEINLPEIWDEPLPMVASVLNQHGTFEEVRRNLPDVELIVSASPF